jgi:plasmid rolling circle replication initiator protein Rep
MNNITNGEILQDIKNGKEKPWREKKMKSKFLADSFFRLELQKRAVRVDKCATFLKFAECPKDEYKKLIDANFCRDRLCPMCAWRLSRKYQNQIHQVLHAAVNVQKMRFVFLTLTVKNVTGDKLEETLDMMFKGFSDLFDLKEVDKPIIGYVRSLEVTYSKKRKDFHPHIHVLMAVQPSYFNGENYISQKRWVELWRHVQDLDYDPVVDVRVVKKRSEGQAPVEAALEMGKYTVKDSDYIHIKDNDLTDCVVFVLAHSLKGRRLIGFGKLFRKLHKELNLSDLESDKADLIGADEHNCTCPVCSSNLLETLYKWRPGINVYIGSKEM